MKKRILSVLLCLCMALVLLPTTALAEEIQLVEDVTFGYAYDAQRSPAFPDKEDDTDDTKKITLSSLDYPLLAEGRGHAKDTNAGDWTLTRVGTYSYVKTTGVNISFVSTVADNYDVTADEIVIHELKDGSDRIAYGVVIAYDRNNGYAVFIGNNISGSGAGYLLSTTPKSGSVKAIADMIATDFVKNLSISLSQTAAHTFPKATVGYGDQTSNALSVTVTNTGNAATGELTVALSGEGKDSFELSKTNITSIPIDENAKTATFTVKPKTNLAAGTYTATVTVSGTDIVAKSFDVTFTVEAPAPAVRPRPTTPAASTTTVDSPKTADNSGLFLWTVLLFVSGAGVLGTAVYSNRKRHAE